MAKIEDTKGRRDNNSGYTRLFGDVSLGNLMSKTHAASIRAGTELEKKILESIDSSFLVEDLDDFLQKTDTKEGVYLCGKKTIRKSKYRLQEHEPDFMIFIHQKGRRECLVVEVKDGDAFDTKKSKGERENIENFAKNIALKIPYSVSWAMCCFNADTREKVVEAFKHCISEDNALTGEEFCEILGIDYQKIIANRAADQKSNRDFFFRQVEEIKKKLRAR